MGVGAYKKSTTSYTPRDRCLKFQFTQAVSRILLGGIIGSLLFGSAAYGAPDANAPSSGDITPSESPAPLKPIIEDGVYFYGSVPEPDAIGSAYMVFEAYDSQVVGAIYMPQSSFDCFRGEVADYELAMEIINSYTQEVYDYSLAFVAENETIASPQASAMPLQIEGFHHLGEPRRAELEILQTCTNHFPLPVSEL